MMIQLKNTLIYNKLFVLLTFESFEPLEKSDFLNFVCMNEQEVFITALLTYFDSSAAKNVISYSKNYKKIRLCNKSDF